MILHPVLSDNTIASLHPSAITAAVCAEVIFANTSPFGPLSTGCERNMWRSENMSFHQKQLLCLNNTSWCMYVWIVWYGCVFCLYVMHLYVSSHRTASTTQMKHHQVLSSQSAVGKYHPKKTRRLRCVLFLHRGELLSRQAQCQMCSVLNERVRVIHIMDDDKIWQDVEGMLEHAWIREEAKVEALKKHKDNDCKDDLDGHHGDENDGILSENTRMQTNLLETIIGSPKICLQFQHLFSGSAPSCENSRQPGLPRQSVFHPQPHATDLLGSHRVDPLPRSGNHDWWITQGTDPSCTCFQIVHLIKSLYRSKLVENIVGTASSKEL